MLGELFSTWWDLMQVGAVFALVGGGLFAGLQATRRQITPEATWIVFLVALVAGLGQAFAQRSLVDNAFIHFRVARNVLHGHGPVFNPGEYVEGVSALGWTLLLALGGVTGLEIPTVSVVLTVLAFVGLGALALRIGQGLWEPDTERVYLPFAAMLILVQGTITPFATSGMETAVVAFTTLAAAGALVSRRDVLAGAMAALSAMIRPDHAVFLLAAALVVGLRDARRLPKLLAPALAIVPFVAFKLWFYGSLIPNPYYALDANTLPVALGASRFAAVVVGEHLWLVGLLFAGWWMASVSEQEDDLRRFATLGVLGHVAVITALGASQTYGQLYVTDIVLLLLGAEALTHHRTRVPNVLAAGLLGATIGGLPLIKPQSHGFDMAETHTFFPVDGLQPVKLRHHLQRLATPFRKAHRDGGSTVLATCCGVGVLAYFAETEVIHTEGLTDAHLARSERVDLDYLREREVDLLRQPWSPAAYRHLTGVSFVGHDNLAGFWHMLRYDRERVAEIRATGKSVTIIDFEKHLDRYLAELDQKPPPQVATDLAFFDQYYFAYNDDDARRAPIARRAGVP
ncbi:MAG: hypothetical protein EP330_26930 [Deltaproteobacteria bacterium]|nr:MAG: hypothetical protein EP330_26930 [Deltaproteobacteria bacterium]